jgi:recombinase-like zinc beta ribbon protein
MHGSTGGRNGTRRYICSGRKQGSPCEELAVPADEIEAAVAAYIREYAPPHEVKLAIVRRLRELAANGISANASYQDDRNRLEGQLERLKDLYVLGDLTNDEYTYRRQLLEQELAALEPPVVHNAEEAAAALTNFGLFWEREQDATRRNKLLRAIFETVTASGGKLVAVTPRDAFCPTSSLQRMVGKYGSDGTRTRDLRRDRPAF